MVAGEVRKLADLSKKAANEIMEISQDSIELTETTGRRMKEMMIEIDKTTELVSEISSSSEEQLRGAEQVNAAIQELNNIAQQNASSSEELAASADELSSQSDGLKKIVAYFKVIV